MQSSEKVTGSGRAVESLGLRSDALAGKVAVVTGAGDGIGLETAHALAWLGAAVVIAEINAETGILAAELIRSAGGRAYFIHTDVSNAGSVADMLAGTHRSLGPVDILVNNAVLCPPVAVLEMDESLWDRVMAVNLKGTFLTSKAVLPDMIDRRSGIIVNMVSTDAMPYLSAYIASKQGIAAFSQSLAGEVGEHGVHVIAFAPGFVDTPGLRGAARGLAPRMGLSEEQFMKLSLHPAYPDSAMPADHAGAAAAYLITALSEEYHGELVNGYQVLEQAGFLQAQPVEDAPAALPADEQSSGRKDGDLLESLNSAAGLSARFIEMLVETEEELKRLPVFVRPLARSGIKSKSGMSLQDWRRAAESLKQQLEQARGAGQIHALPAAYRQMEAYLDRLADYYRQVPAETLRFTKDADVIAQVQQVSQSRVALIQSLKSAVRALAQA